MLAPRASNPDASNSTGCGGAACAAGDEFSTEHFALDQDISLLIKIFLLS
jgi:hypothetical protein